jgi:hypothetical protein
MAINLNVEKALCSDLKGHTIDVAVFKLLKDPWIILSKVHPQESGLGFSSMEPLLSSML